MYFSDQLNIGGSFSGSEFFVITMCAGAIFAFYHVGHKPNVLVRMPRLITRCKERIYNTA